MAFLFTDGFDSYNATSDLAKKWGTADSPWAFNSSGGRSGGGYVSCATGAQGAVLMLPASIFNGAVSSGIHHYGFYVKFSAIPGSQYQPGRWADAGGTLRGGMSLNTSGQLILSATNSTTGTSIFTGSRNVCDNQWHWLEFQIQMSSSILLHQCYVDGVFEVSVSAAFEVGNIPVNFCFLQSTVAQGVVTSIDDFILYDDNSPGPTSSNYPLGQREIKTLRPSADSAVQFSRSAGANNYALVNEQAPDLDVTYVEDGTSGDQDLYDFDDISGNPTINGIMLNGSIKNPQPGTINFKQICKNNVTQTDGTSTVAPSGYMNFSQPFATNPDGGGAWTQAALNTAKIGIKVV